MKRKLSLLFVALVAMFTTSCSDVAKISSLEDLLPYLSQDDVNVKMKPGIYRISVDDIKAGKYDYSIEISEGRITHALLPFHGSNTNFDFTGVTIEVETGVVNAFEGKYFEVSEVHTFGSNITIKGLKLINVGSVHDFPQCSWVNIIMDGANNLFEDVELFSFGSKPYGYGEVFGKGGPYTIYPRKHCGWLVRGEDNHVKNCTIIHHAYGHYLFIQGTEGITTIEGCYIEGEVVSTDAILAEKGTGSDADKVDFKTSFDYTLPVGYVLSTGEDGIRTYGTGTTIINGKKIKRDTGGEIIIKDCVVKNARSGISLTQGKGTRLVENCMLIGCQDGFSVGRGSKIVNCRADATFGPALRYVSDRDRDTEIEITIIPYEGDKLVGNGSKHVAHIFGSDLNVTLRKGEGLEVEEGMCIAVGGDSYTIGNLAKQENYKAVDVTIVNETGYPILIDDNATNVTVTTNGEVIDNGTNTQYNPNYISL